MSKDTRPQTNKVNIDPRETKRYQIDFLSTGIGDNSSLSITTASLTTYNKTLKKKLYQIPEKCLKLNMGGNIMIPQKGFRQRR